MEIGHHVTIEDVVRVARFREEVTISESALQKIEESRKVVEEILKSEKAVYGVNTGFGALASVRVSREKLEDLQRNILLSHAAGVGEALDEETVRAMMFLRAVSLSKGFSGVRPVVVEKIVEFLNRGVLPFVPSKGSVGASGDLAPLAHTFLPLMGEGYVIDEGKIIKAREYLKKKGIKPLKLLEKEGLALVNGTQAMTAIVSLVLRDAKRLFWLAVKTSALSFEALRGKRDPFDPRVHRLRPHPGQMKVAQKFWELTDGSGIERDETKVQDAYTLRTIPQVYGAVLDTMEYAWQVVEREVNSVTDNPLIFPEGDAISGGNFHGEPISLVADFLAIALTDMGNMIERRIDRILNPKTNEGLSPFLAGGEDGLNSGLMIFQYTAAALCNENKILSHPASSDTIPTSAYQEDHVSMGMNAALKLRKVFENLVHLVSIEALVASRALKMRNGKIAPRLSGFLEELWNRVHHRGGDNLFWEDLQEIEEVLMEKIKGDGEID